ncbi:GxxExxY protein [Sunxiuqinia elliptica]|uniref:GxxExxY protein n=1 Tax=Sunxiuqinia elliptica TaxID=655355 RepID=A0A1I2F8A7_9BACT|nr:GxxExxY protein [Sunxiuqinia elliptica]SFF01263.1 GxxExxY protein [Sunxiuqinia elliptica]
MDEENKITAEIINCAIKVHASLGPGLLESAYQQCLFYELKKSGLDVEKEKPLPVTYKEVKLDCGYRLDLVVEKKVIVELKSVETISNIHLAQMITYLKLSKCKLGLLINFNVNQLVKGVKRVINDR